MALKIKWSKRADAKFDKILEYLEGEFGEVSAVKFVNKVYEFLDLLAEFPEMGTLENKEYSIRGFVIIKQVTIFYQVRDNMIVLLNFYDNRQRPKTKRF